MSRHFSRPQLRGPLALALSALLLGACASGHGTRQSASVVQYLYPGGREVAVTPDIPTLRLPLRVGIAFVPPAQSSGRHYFDPTQHAALPESDRIELMRSIAARFRAQPYIKSVEIVPSAYLTPGGGFDNLDQLRSMFAVDVAVLLSYDQVQFHDESALTFSYWTLVGAYLVEGEKNDTRTLMDAVVLDIASRKLLFRAPGTSVVKGSATPVNLSEEQRRDRVEGFRLAAGELTTALEGELERFEERVREAPDAVRVVRTEEFERRARATGAGAIDPAGVLLATMLGTLTVASAALRGRGGRR